MGVGKMQMQMQMFALPMNEQKTRNELVATALVQIGLTPDGRAKRWLEARLEQYLDLNTPVDDFKRLPRYYRVVENNLFQAIQHAKVNKLPGWPSGA